MGPLQWSQLPGWLDCTYLRISHHRPGKCTLQRLHFGVPSLLHPAASLPCRCRGKGRLNYRGAAMLPQGVWPQWCVPS